VCIYEYINVCIYEYINVCIFEYINVRWWNVGNALVVDANMPYAPLSKFGNKFLNRFQASVTSTPVLENLTLIDTPGILSGEKQLIDRCDITLKLGVDLVVYDKFFI